MTNKVVLLMPMYSLIQLNNHRYQANTFWRWPFRLKENNFDSPFLYRPHGVTIAIAFLFCKTFPSEFHYSPVTAVCSGYQTRRDFRCDFEALSPFSLIAPKNKPMTNQFYYTRFVASCIASLRIFPVYASPPGTFFPQYSAVRFDYPL